MKMAYHLVEEYAQEQSMLYESMLGMLHSVVLAFHASHQKPSAQTVRNAEHLFNEKVRMLSRVLGKRTADMLTPVSTLDEGVYYAWVGDIEEELYRTQERCFLANRSKFVAALRVGGAFDGLSDLLGDVEGAMGRLVQLRSQEMNWSFRSRDGRNLNCLRTMHVLYRLLAVRAFALRFLIECPDRNTVVSICDKHGGVLHEARVGDMLGDARLVRTFFNYNTENYLAVSP